MSTGAEWLKALESAIDTAVKATTRAANAERSLLLANAEITRLRARLEKSQSPDIKVGDVVTDTARDAYPKTLFRVVSDSGTRIAVVGVNSDIPYSWFDKSRFVRVL